MASWLFNTLTGGSSSSKPSPPPVQPVTERYTDEPPSTYTETTNIQSLHLPALDHLRTKRVILASASPRRKELLAHLGITPEIIPSSHPEDLHKPLYTPHEYTLATATAKCLSVYRLATSSSCTTEPSLVLAADTTICLPSGAILEKPQSRAHHISMLRHLRDLGAQDPPVPHKVITAVVGMAPLEEPVEPGYAMESHVETTEVWFDGKCTDELIEAYVETGEGRGKAGGYAIQGVGGVLVREIRGAWDNVVGLPVRGTLRVIEKVMSGDGEGMVEDGEEEE